MKKHKDLIDTTIWNIADVSSNRCMSAKEIRASIRPKIENLVGQILKANPVENRVSQPSEFSVCEQIESNLFEYAKRMQEEFEQYAHKEDGVDYGLGLAEGKQLAAHIALAKVNNIVANKPVHRLL